MAGEAAAATGGGSQSGSATGAPAAGGPPPGAQAPTAAGVPAHSGTPTTPAPMVTPTTGAAGDWMGGLNAEHRGWLQAKNVSTPDQLVTMWKGMEGVMGAPKERLATLPAEIKTLADAAPILQRLGVPASPDKYGLQGPADVVKNTSQIFHEANLTTHQAEAVYSKFTALQANAAQARQAEYEGRVTQEKQALSREWGAAHDQNLAIARRAAQKFGATAEIVNGLEKMASSPNSAGYAALMKFFHQLGVATGEAQFVQGAPVTGILTPEQAKAEREMLMKDQVWVQKYTKSDAAALKKMSELLAAEHGLSL